MAKVARVFVIASFMRDVSVTVDRFALPGETRVGADALESHGGKGSNQAIQAARCGAAVSIVAAVGADAAGRAAMALWGAEHIDAAGAAVHPGQATGLAVIIVDAAGQNQIVIAPGANGALQAADVSALRGTIEAADLVMSSLETPLDATFCAFEIARAAGRTTLLNSAPAPAALPDRLWGLIDILIANELEAATLAALAADADQMMIGKALLARVGAAVVITVGEQGAVLFEKNRVPLRVGAPEVNVIDSTGAGDAFVGAFSAYWAATRDAQGALMQGVAAGSLACTRRGVVPALHDAAAVWQLAGTLTKSPA